MSCKPCLVIVLAARYTQRITKALIVPRSRKHYNG